MGFQLRSGRHVELKLSEDGSHTLYVPELDEHYHSIYGARTESMHVFIRNGFEHCDKKNIRILEIGFGTGLNVLLTLLHKKEKIVEYHSIEKYPLNADLEDLLQYSREQKKKETALFNKIHAAPWNELTGISDDFSLLKLEADLLTIDLPSLYDVVYFDAFAPDVQPELWSAEVFGKIYDTMNEKGIITTYSAKGVVRRTLEKTGFLVERLPGPPRKREMLRGTKPGMY